MGGGIINFPTRFLRWVKIDGDAEGDDGGGGDGGDTPTPVGKPWLEGFIINEGLNDVTLDQAFYHKGWAFYDSTGSIIPSNFRVLTEEEVRNFTENDIYMCTVIPLFNVELIEEYLTRYGIEIPQADTQIEIPYDSYNPAFLYQISSYYQTKIRYSDTAYRNKLYIEKHTFGNGETYYVIYT